MNINNIVYITQKTYCLISIMVMVLLTSLMPNHVIAAGLQVQAQNFCPFALTYSVEDSHNNIIMAFDVPAFTENSTNSFPVSQGASYKIKVNGSYDTQPYTGVVDIWFKKDGSKIQFHANDENNNLSNVHDGGSTRGTTYEWSFGSTHEEDFIACPSTHYNYFHYQIKTFGLGSETHLSACNQPGDSITVKNASAPVCFYPDATGKLSISNFYIPDSLTIHFSGSLKSCVLNLDKSHSYAVSSIHCDDGINSEIIGTNIAFFCTSTSEGDSDSQCPWSMLKSGDSNLSSYDIYDG